MSDSYVFAMDLSGVPPQHNTVIGLVRFEYDKKDKLVKNFKNKFSKYLKKKGWELDRYNLRRMLEFLGENDIKMVAVKCTLYNWNRRYSNLPKDSAFKMERLYGILYFLALKELSRKGKHYDVVACTETFMDMGRVLTTCKRLAKYYGIDYSFSLSSGNLNFTIKIADYVAAAGRKFKRVDLDEFDNFKLIVTDIPYDYIRYAFQLF